MFSGIASVLGMIYWDAGRPSAGCRCRFFFFFFFFFFMHLLPFKRLNVGMDRQTDRQRNL